MQAKTGFLHEGSPGVAGSRFVVAESWGGGGSPQDFPERGVAHPWQRRVLSEKPRS